MEPGHPSSIVSDERQQVLEHNVHASATNSELSVREQRRIAGDLVVIKWAAVFAAVMLLLLVLK